jgi:hypothetical protein
MRNKPDPYQVEVKIQNKTTKEWEWKAVHPTDGPPYEYETEREARESLCISDRLYPERYRIVQVKAKGGTP